MRPCHDIRYGAPKNPAYRVSVRLVRVIKAADHGRKKNAKSELKISFSGKPHNHELRPPQLAIDLQRVLHHRFMQTEARTPLGDAIVPKYAFLGCHEGVDSSGNFDDGGHLSDGSQLRCRCN